MKHYNFVKFDGIYPRGDTKIAIHNSGIIRLSSQFCRLLNIEKFQYVVLFYDKVNRAIAIKFTNNDEEGRLKITKDRTAASISGKAFMTANKLNLRSYFGRYDWEKQNIPNIGEVFIIKLGKK